MSLIDYNKKMTIVKKLKTTAPKQERKENPWVTHCKKYASEKGLSYKQAVSEAKASYTSSKTAPPPLVRQAAIEETKTA